MNAQTGREEIMLRWILIISNAIIAVTMLLSSGIASDEGDAKTFAVLIVLMFVSLFSAAYMLFC